MQSKEIPANTSPLGCLVRLGWIAFGNLILALCLLGMSRRPWQMLDFCDAIYLSTVAALIALRYVDIRYYAGTTSTGEPCTLADWHAYSWRVLAFAGVAWCAARGFAWFNGAA